MHYHGHIKYLVNFLFFFQLDLLDPKGRKLMASCFDPTLGGRDSIGWCATCDSNARKGQRGYCGPGETSREDEAPIIYPNSTNWGFCHKDCRTRKGDENLIQARARPKNIAVFYFSKSK